jgi:hypothetical protein
MLTREADEEDGASWHVDKENIQGERLSYE